MGPDSLFISKDVVQMCVPFCNTMEEDDNDDVQTGLQKMDIEGQVQMSFATFGKIMDWCERFVKDPMPDITPGQAPRPSPRSVMDGLPPYYRDFIMGLTPDEYVDVAIANKWLGIKALGHLVGLRLAISFTECTPAEFRAQYGASVPTKEQEEATKNDPAHAFIFDWLPKA